MLSPLRKMALKSQLVPCLLRIIKLIAMKGSDLFQQYSLLTSNPDMSSVIFSMVYVPKKTRTINNNNKKPFQRTENFLL